MTDIPVDGSPLAVGYRLEHFTILGLLAEGGMAQVYLARDEEAFARSGDAQDALVVLKRVLPHLSHNSRFESMFVNEARLATMIRHPNVVEVKGLLREQGELFLVMEFLDGKNLLALGKTCDSGGFWVPFPLLARVIADAAAGVHQAHILTDEYGRKIDFIHRDLSPENIVVCFDGRVKVVDFGIAKARMSPETTQAGVIKGKLNYLAPEAVQGLKLDARADIYALGVSLYLFMTARFPYTGRNTEALLQAMNKGSLKAPKEINPHIPLALQNICLRCLAHDREQRYATAAELQAELVDFIGQNGARIYAEHLARFMDDMYPRETDAMRAWVAGISKTGAPGRKDKTAAEPAAQSTQPLMQHGGTQELDQAPDVMHSGFTDPGQWSQASDVHNRATLIVSSLEASGLHVIPREQALLNKIESGETEAMGQKAHALAAKMATATSAGRSQRNKARLARPRSTRRSRTRSWVMWSLVLIILLLGGSLVLLAKALWNKPPNKSIVKQAPSSRPGTDNAAQSPGDKKSASKIPPLEPLVDKASSSAAKHAQKPQKTKKRARKKRLYKKSQKRKKVHRTKNKKRTSRRRFRRLKKTKKTRSKKKQPQNH